MHVSVCMYWCVYVCMSVSVCHLDGTSNAELGLLEDFVSDARVVWVLSEHRLAHVDASHVTLALEISEGQLEANRRRGLELQLPRLIDSQSIPSIHPSNINNTK